MFDIGVNLTSSQFAKDRDDVVARAQAAGVSGMLLTGTNLHESQQAQQLAKHYPRCWSTAGVHPHDSSSWTQDTADALRQLAEQPEVVAIGECGLDFNRNFSTPKSRSGLFPRNWRWRQNVVCPFFYTAMPMTVFWRSWIPGFPACPVRCCTVSPAH
jgi:TatD DNase family protein